MLGKVKHRTVNSPNLPRAFPTQKYDLARQTQSNYVLIKLAAVMKGASSHPQEFSASATERVQQLPKRLDDYLSSSPKRLRNPWNLVRLIIQRRNWYLG